jgi:hypothetical protein
MNRCTRPSWWLVLLMTTLASAAKAQPEASEGVQSKLAPQPASTDPEAALPDAEPLDTASGGATEELSASELDALGLDVEGPRVDTDFHFWGFADFTSSLLIKPKGAVGIVQGRHQSFYVGNFNLYFSKNLSDSFRTMAEVRLTYLPNGSYSVDQGGYAQLSTSTVDYANGQSTTRWGGIIMQRIYLEWTLHHLLSVRGGQFLTPIGIWNVDHGSPAYIPAQRPLAIVSGLYPERQMGLEALGRWSASNANTLGYHLTLSNGTGPVSEYRDLDRNKAIGARLYWERYSAATFLRVGASSYYGRDTASTPRAAVTANSIDVSSKIDTQSDNLTLAADALFKVGGVHLQAEWVSLQKRYTESGRVVHTVVGGPVASAGSADTFTWAGYLLAAYRFGWRNITPFATLQGGRLILTNQSLPDSRAALLGFTAGLNVSPADSVIFKLEYAYINFLEAAPVIKTELNALLLQAAWAF